MKKYLLFICCMWAFGASYAQGYVILYTPRGSSIQTFITSETSKEEIRQITNIYIATYGAENVLAPASNKYNCHSYAWNISEGGTQIVWMNQLDDYGRPNISKYWNDGSYIETTESEAEKIFYYAGDHSAIKSKTVPGKYESKWGRAPLIRHSPTNVPSIYKANYRKYYKKNISPPPISGPTVVCSQGTYTIQDLPSGTSIQWSTSNGNLQLISGQGTRTAVFSKRSKGQCAIRAQVIINGNTINTEKTGIWVGEPDIWDIDGYESLPAPGAEYYRAHVSGNTSCIWECNDKTWCEITPFQTSAVFDFKRAGTYIISATGVNDCGRSNTVYYTVRVYNRRTFSLFPNPATDAVTLKLTEGGDGILSPQGQGSLTTKGVTNTYEIQLWSGLTMLRSFKTNQLTFQISIAGLPTGLYFVRVIKDGQTYTEKLIKN